MHRRRFAPRRTATLAAAGVLAFATAALAAVDLLSFTAERTSAGVLLKWKTAAETKCGSFRILKCAGADCGGRQHEIVKAIKAIPCKGGLVGADYEATDASATDRKQTYSYMLREYQDDGKTKDYGPVVLLPDMDKAAWTKDPKGAGGTDAVEDGGCAAAPGATGALGLGLLLFAALRRRR